MEGADSYRSATERNDTLHVVTLSLENDEHSPPK
jgi:hypothetical protein